MIRRTTNIINKITSLRIKQ